MSSDQTVEKKTRLQEWEDNYNSVLEFAEKNGHLNLPRRDAEMRRLSNWLCRQKKRKIISNSERDKLRLLGQYGYSENYSPPTEADENWNKFFDELKEYRKVQGHLVVSKKYRPLSEWIAHQRKMEKQGRLKQCRKERLLEIGFVFKRNKPLCKKKRYTEAQEKKWNDMYEKLCKFRDQCGHCVVHLNDKDLPELANWVSAQRVLFGQGLIDEARKKKLDDIGFTWSVRKKASAESSD